MARKNKQQTIWMVLVGLIIMGSLLYLNFSPSSHQPLPARHEVEKSGAGAVADFTNTTTQVHATVDEIFKKNSLAVRDVKEFVKEVPRQKVEGVIRWHTRQLLIAAPNDTAVETVQQTIQQGVQRAGAQVIASQRDQYQGLSVLRLDVGFTDKVAGDEITIISDRIYIAKEKTQGKEKEKAILPARPTGKGNGQMAIVIDDFGYSKEPIAAFCSIGRPLTFAVLPYHPFSNEAAARGLSSGHQVILHLPMEPLAQSEQSEKLTIGVAMSNGEIQEMTQKAINQIPGLIGVNNHQGSRATADKRVMKIVLGQVKANSLFFLDSRTNGQSVGAESARQMGVRTGENQLFIDNSDEVSEIKAKLRTGQKMALNHGSVTVIGHARINTAIAVREMIDELEEKGIELVFVSQLVQ